ncbi:MAG: TatD family hydrolase [Sphaerochaeta sp.]|jgi:TatD DNase family protein|nr:TatD family hydrolase [Sphaerochaeta sp.]MCI2045271.1 TatD family hydrolase [Sphaerochaeta sp.]MCI2076974.1 TatD family hydrolase [Sphaerochaeta sp.]MCI2097015.1 TatD family hydrolase [Sphaerochaeta sp.]MCI2103821.1 TatD family hydrolase [Sphaerochaeta sp.]
MEQTIKLTDSHFHILSLSEKGLDTNDLLERMEAQGMEAIDIGTVSDDLPARRKLLGGRNYPLSAGIGPWGVGQDIEELKRMIASYGPVCAIGEIGLDNHWKNYAAPLAQETFLSEQIDLADSLGLPVIFHVRDADEQIRRILKSRPFPKGGIMHCFEGDDRTCDVALQTGFFISFSGVVTYKGNEWMEAIVRMVPDDRLLLETDSPYLSPVPLRGLKNTPLSIIHTYEKVAEIRKTTVESLATIVRTNLHAFLAAGHTA